MPDEAPCLLKVDSLKDDAKLREAYLSQAAVDCLQQ